MASVAQNDPSRDPDTQTHMHTLFAWVIPDGSSELRFPVMKGHAPHTSPSGPLPPLQ